MNEKTLIGWFVRGVLVGAGITISYEVIVTILQKLVDVNGSNSREEKRAEIDYFIKDLMEYQLLAELDETNPVEYQKIIAEKVAFIKMLKSQLDSTPA